MRTAGCGQVGLAPGPELFGYQPGACVYNLSTGVFRQVDWTTIDFLDIQGEGLLGEVCLGQNGMNEYVRAATAIAAYVRAGNPRIIVAAQLSFRFTAPTVMTGAVSALNSIVDGFLLSYPLNPALEHKYCSPRNLAALLQAVR
jgi:hypothetical protein